MYLSISDLKRLLRSSHEEIRHLIERRYAMHVLERLAAPRDCGCHPVCHCNGAESLKIELEEMKSEAREALMLLKGEMY